MNSNPDRPNVEDIRTSRGYRVAVVGLALVTISFAIGVILFVLAVAHIVGLGWLFVLWFVMLGESLLTWIGVVAVTVAMRRRGQFATDFQNIWEMIVVASGDLWSLLRSGRFARSPTGALSVTDTTSDAALCLQHALGSDKRLQLLASLAYWLGMAARGTYAQAGIGVEAPPSRLRCFNELMIVVANQLRGAAGLSGADYPDGAFVEALIDRALIGDCSDGLNWALERSLDEG